MRKLALFRKLCNTYLTAPFASAILYQQIFLNFVPTSVKFQNDKDSDSVTLTFSNTVRQTIQLSSYVIYVSEIFFVYLRKFMSSEEDDLYKTLDGISLAFLGVGLVAGICGTLVQLVHRYYGRELTNAYNELLHSAHLTEIAGHGMKDKPHRKRAHKYSLTALAMAMTTPFFLIYVTILPFAFPIEPLYFVCIDFLRFMGINVMATEESFTRNVLFMLGWLSFFVTITSIGGHCFLLFTIIDAGRLYCYDFLATHTLIKSKTYKDMLKRYLRLLICHNHLAPAFQVHYLAICTFCHVQSVVIMCIAIRQYETWPFPLTALFLVLSVESALLVTMYMGICFEGHNVSAALVEKSHRSEKICKEDRLQWLAMKPLVIKCGSYYDITKQGILWDLDAMLGNLVTLLFI